MTRAPFQPILRSTHTGLWLDTKNEANLENRVQPPVFLDELVIHRACWLFNKFGDDTVFDASINDCNR